MHQLVQLLRRFCLPLELSYLLVERAGRLSGEMLYLILSRVYNKEKKRVSNALYAL